MLGIIYYILSACTLLYGVFFVITGLVGLIRYKKGFIKKYNPKYKFGVLIAARNEENVIANLIESLKSQKYPQELYDIYVIPNNCTDNTKKVSKAAGAKILNCDIAVKSKGEVLSYTLKKLKKQTDIGAYVIFDADNVVHPNFLSRMNDALCSGYQVAQGFRDSKNSKDNWLSGSYSIYYWLQNLFFNKSRMYLNGSASINGTGFMIKKDIIDKYGFNTFSITEDMEFTAQCAINNIKICFVEDAITYDEQPITFKQSWVQRKRWSTGMYQCLRLYTGKLLKSFVKNNNLSSIDIFLLFASPIIQIIGFIMGIGMIIKTLLLVNGLKVLIVALMSILLSFLTTYLITICLNLFIIKYNKKQLEDAFSGIILFAIFILTWIPINIICLFKENSNWEEIKHKRSIDIKEIIE